MLPLRLKSSQKQNVLAAKVPRHKREELAHVCSYGVAVTLGVGIVKGIAIKALRTLPGFLIMSIAFWYLRSQHHLNLIIRKSDRSFPRLKKLAL